MSRDIPLGAFLDVMFLQIDREVDMRDAPIAERGATRQMRHLLDVRRSHDSGVVNCYIHKDAIEIDVLLRMSVYQIMVMVAGDRQDRLAIELCVIQSVQQMDAAWA